MQISAKELRHLASDVDDMHHEVMSTFKEEAAELHLEAGSQRRGAASSRRPDSPVPAATLLAVGGPLSPLGRFFPAAAQGLTDTVIAGYAQSVELAAVAAYTAAAPALPADVRPVGRALRLPPPGPRRRLRRGGRRRRPPRGQPHPRRAR